MRSRRVRGGVLVKRRYSFLPVVLLRRSSKLVDACRVLGPRFHYSNLLVFVHPGAIEGAVSCIRPV
jgi:hypothetical protein